MFDQIKCLYSTCECCSEGCGGDRAHVSVYLQAVKDYFFIYICVINKFGKIIFHLSSQMRFINSIW